MLLVGELDEHRSHQLGGQGLMLLAVWLDGLRPLLRAGRGRTGRKRSPGRAPPWAADFATVTPVHRFACVLLVDRAGHLLLQERDEHPVIDPEKWGLVGGHVEDGEDFEPAAYRELVEETGLRLPPGTLRLWRELEVFHEAYGTLDITTVWVAAVDATDADVVVGEGRQIVFVEPSIARNLDLTASARVAVPAFLDSADYAALRGQVG